MTTEEKRQQTNNVNTLVSTEMPLLHFESILFLFTERNINLKFNRKAQNTFLKQCFLKKKGNKYTCTLNDK